MAVVYTGLPTDDSGVYWPLLTLLACSDKRHHSLKEVLYKYLIHIYQFYQNMHTDCVYISFFSSGVQLMLYVPLNGLLALLHCVVFLNVSCIYYSKIELIICRTELSIKERDSC
jgi:hypothetical protein